MSDYYSYFLGGETIPKQLWADASDNIYNTNTNNVGIGTNTPTTELQVIGTIKGDRVLGVDWPDITNKIEPVQSDWKEENPQLQG